MHAQVLYGGRDLRYQEVPAPVPGPGEVLIRVYACSICGSDLHAYLGSHPRLTLPRILGHEFAGEVAAVGAGVTGIAAGDRVCADNDLPCGECEFCRAGRANICENLKIMGFNTDGAYAEYALATAANIYRLPASVSFDQASLAQTFGIGYNAVVNRARVQAGERVAVIGAGPIGLGAAAIAKAVGAHVTSIDLLDYRLDLAKEAGVDATVNPGREDLPERVKQLTDSKGFPKVLECVGGHQDQTISQAVGILRRGGLLTVVGTFPANKATIPIAYFKDREMELIGARGNPRAFGPVLELMGQGRLAPDLFISHTFPLSRAVEALELMGQKGASVFKVVLRPQES